MRPFKHIKAKTVGWIGLAVVLCLVLVYAGGILLGFTAAVSAALVRVLELIGMVGIPLAGAVVLGWFAYKLLLEPVLRQRKLDRIREYRARRTLDSRE